jgi:ribose transport system ATP-binding protein
MSNGPARLEMRHITKNFGGVQALRDVSVSAHAAEVHALCGENGAGKSTLMKILAGAISDYEGEIVLDGRPLRFSGPRDAEDAGIRIIYQELNLVTEMTVAANIFLGRERTRGLGWLDDRAMEAEARRLFERLGTPINPRALIGDLRIGDQQMVEIAKALAFDAAVLIMDEPTSALAVAEVEAVLRLIRRVRDNGVSVILITHRLQDLFRVCDRIAVMYEGLKVAERRTGETDLEDLVRLIVGEKLRQAA